MKHLFIKFHKECSSMCRENCWKRKMNLKEIVKKNKSFAFFECFLSRTRIFIIDASIDARSFWDFILKQIKFLLFKRQRPTLFNNFILQSFWISFNFVFNWYLELFTSKRAEDFFTNHWKNFSEWILNSTCLNKCNFVCSKQN